MQHKMDILYRYYLFKEQQGLLSDGEQSYFLMKYSREYFLFPEKGDISSPEDIFPWIILFFTPRTQDAVIGEDKNLILLKYDFFDFLFSLYTKTLTELSVKNESEIQRIFSQKTL